MKKVDIKKVAKKVAVSSGMPDAEDYNMCYRDFDNMIEIIGLMNDPNYIADAKNEGVLPPKSWLTIGVIPASTKLRKYL